MKSGVSLSKASLFRQVFVLNYYKIRDLTGGSKDNDQITYFGLIHYYVDGGEHILIYNSTSLIVKMRPVKTRHEAELDVG